jgi:hypothetical protein
MILKSKKFLQFVDEFSALHIEQDPDPKGEPHSEVFLNKVVNHHIVQLPSNHIPRGLVPLERLFDGNDVEVKDKISRGSTDTSE